MNLITGITLGIALVGVVLSVINTKHLLNRDRIILRVTPQWLRTPEGEPLSLGVEIINLSYIAVGIEEIGFFLSRRRNSKKILLTDIIPTNEAPFSFPYVLQSRSSMTVAVPGYILISKELKDVKCAYARTSCGLIFRGNSGALKQAVYKAKRKDSDTKVQKS